MENSSKPFKDTWLRRNATLASLKLFRRFQSRSGTVRFLTKKMCVKFESGSVLSEAATLRFIAKHTSIPVPKVYCAFVHKGQAYTVMERIKGKMLIQGWFQRSEESQAAILNQLKDYIAEMRSLTPPENMGVANIDGGVLWDCRLYGNNDFFGPFKSIADFHLYCRMNIEKLRPKEFPEVAELIHLYNSGSWELRFTHGDLSSLNILVDGDRVVGIVDWETSGWYPAYWEYCTACNVNPRNYGWRAYIDKFLDPLPQDLHMDLIRQKYFGDIPGY